MPEARASPLDERVLVLAPTPKDARLCRAMLGEAGMACDTFADLGTLCQAMEQPAGAAVLTHELRNPLAPLRNALHILQRLAAPVDRAEEVLALMQRQVDHLVRLIDDLLDVSRITRGRIELRQQPVELAVVVRAAVETS